MRWALLLVLAVLASFLAGPAHAGPGALTCSDVGGVFVGHGVDGRGDCEPADPRAACHLPPAQWPADGNYVAELTLTPPFANGVLSNQSFVPILINGADNKDCWKLPAS